MHSKKPIYTLLMRKDVPPWLISGRGCPVTKFPTDIYICSNACITITIPIPIDRNAVYGSSHFFAIFPQVYSSVRYSSITSIAPNSPSSSIITAKI